MAKKLIVLINDFPYKNGETFFENEIDFLSTKFEQIVIFSVYGKKGETATRSVRSNVIVYPLSCNHNRMKYIIKGIFSNNRKFSARHYSGKKVLTSLYLKGKNISVYKKCIKFFKKNTIDKQNDYYIYSYWLTLGVASIMLKDYFLFKLKKEIRTISRCHRYDIYSELMPLNFHPFQKAVIRELDSVYSCSTHGMIYLQNKYPDLKNKILISRLSTNDHGTKQYDWDNSKKRIFLTVSGFRPVKRLDLFAKAFIKAAEKNQNIYWHAIGDGPAFENVQNIVINSKQSDRVLFLGNLLNEEVYRYYYNSNVFFFANVSSSEGVPVSIMEAISFGVPVIATDVGGNSEIVNADNGVLLKDNINEEELSDVIIKCVSIDKSAYLKMCSNSRKKWDTFYNSQKNLESWYLNIIGDNKEAESKDGE